MKGVISPARPLKKYKINIISLIANDLRLHENRNGGDGHEENLGEGD